MTASGGNGSNHARVARIALQWRWLSRHDGERFKVTSYWEASAIRFDARHLTPGFFDTADDTLHGVAIAPVFRIEILPWTTDTFQPFVEFAIGLAIFDADTMRAGAFDSKRLGTRWQFEDRFVLGAILGKKRRFEIGYGRMHYSNAGLHDVNEGINANLLMLGVRFLP